MDKNFLNFTGLSYSQIKDAVVSRMAADPRFSTFTESELNALLVEIFSATTDFTNYYIERRAEESFFDTAKLRSSIILLSKMLGYVSSRPNPATTAIRIRIKSLPNGTTTSSQLLIPKFSAFTYGSSKFILKDSLVYTVTSEDIAQFAVDPTYYIDLEFTDKNSVGLVRKTNELTQSDRTDITLVQGEIKTHFVDGTVNTEKNKRFQVYKISDKEFSNLYGSEDYGVNVITNTTNILDNVTRVGVGTSIGAAFSVSNNQSDFDNSGEFYIDRRSFLNETTIPELDSAEAGSTTKFCVVRTTPDDNVEILFADGNIGKVGPMNLENLYVKYLATKGAQSNQLGVIGNKVIPQETSFGAFSPSNVDFYLRKNITGGSDKEDVDSIKMNAPGIFYSLDRCVSTKDYINFLKTIVSPINVKNAIAWGEQEESQSSKIANIKLFNVVLFSILGELYSSVSENFKNVYTSVATDGYSIDNGTSNDWFKLLVMGDSVTPIKDVENPVDQTGTAISQVYAKLYPRSQATVKNVYISPIINDYKVTGTIYLNPLADRVLAEKKIRTALYEFLNTNADFNVNVYLSNIIEVIEKFSEVNYADVKLSSNVSDDVTIDSVYITSIGSEVAEIKSTFVSDPIGKIYFDTNGDTISDPSLFTCRELYESAFSEQLSGYSSFTKSAILYLMPNLQTRTKKIDDTIARTFVAWPINELWDTSNNSFTTVQTKNTITGFAPTYRNMYLYMFKKTYEDISSLVDAAGSVGVTKQYKDFIEYVDTYISQRDKCFCSIRAVNEAINSLDSDANRRAALVNADPNELLDFITSDKLYNCFVKLKNTFVTDIIDNSFDSYGNIANFSLRNEIARITAPDLGQYSFKR
jgi:hypothetical protein